MSDEPCPSGRQWWSGNHWPSRHRTAFDVGIAVCFVLLDTAATLAGITWWPAHPGPLAWALLGLQAAACLSLVARRRAPLLVIAVLGGFTLAVTLLIWPAGALTPANMGNVWAPFATVLAAYAPFFYGRDRRVAFVAVALLTEEGDPALASPLVGRTTYRIVREALTNVRKHAPGARVTVHVSYGGAQVRLAVRNTAAPGAADQSGLAGTGSGLGLAGLRQRVELVAGTLRAGPAPDGGFCLEATLPAYVPTAEPVA